MQGLGSLTELSEMPNLLLPDQYRYCCSPRVWGGEKRMKFILCEVSSSFAGPSLALWPHDYDCMMGFSWVGTCTLGTFSPSDDGEKRV